MTNTISDVLERNGLHPENHMQCARHAIEDSGSLEIHRVLETVARLLAQADILHNAEDSEDEDERIRVAAVRSRKRADARAILAEVLR